MVSSKQTRSDAGDETRYDGVPTLRLGEFSTPPTQQRQPAAASSMPALKV